MSSDKEETILRTILKNEITWLVFLVGAIMAFVYNVIIPLNTMQITLAQMQNDIGSIKQYDARITQSANEIIKLQGQIEALAGSKKQ